jgi:hypothetical protein
MRKKKTITSPLVFIASLTKFNGKLKYPSIQKVGIVNLDIQTCTNNFKLMIGKWFSKYKIKDTMLNYLAMIYPLSLQMLEEENKVVKPVLQRR